MIRKKILLILLFILFNCKNSFSKEQWILDKKISTIDFELPLLLAKNVKGKFNDIDGLVETDITKQKNTKGIFTVKIESIEINYDNYKDLLLSDIFFNSKKFPIALIDTNSFAYKDEDKIDLVVELQIKDKSLKIPLFLEIIRLAEKLVQIKGELFFSRSDFNLGNGKWSSSAMLKDQVKIQVSLFLFKK